MLGMLASRGAAQASPDQDKNLSGLGKAHLAVITNDGAMSAVQIEQVKAAATLELRKAGLRLVQTEGEIDIARDAVITLAIYKIGRALSTDAIVDA